MEKRLATVDDILQISQLYFDTYEGQYPDPLMKDFIRMKKFIISNEGNWFIAIDNGQVIGSVLAVYDKENQIAKAYGAVVRTECRGQKVMEDLLGYGIEFLKNNTEGVDVIYSTTRTVNEAAQTLTEKLGFKKIGIFPNAHRTNEYETHGLTAIFTESAIKKRHTDFKLHHQLSSLFNVVSTEVGLESLETIVPEAPSINLISPGELEIIQSPKFVDYRYQTLKETGKLQFEFFPFHRPNIIVLSPDQSVELFCHLSVWDGYCVVIGGKMPSNMNFTELFLKTNRLLRDAGARYIEIILRADRPKIVESLLKAKFVPCAYFPSFQSIGDKRYDFIVLSRLFEIFDFQNVKLKGLNQVYLEEYYKSWKMMALNPKLLDI